MKPNALDFLSIPVNSVAVAVESDELESLGIHRGEYAVFKVTDQASEGDIVVARLSDGRTIVTRYHVGDPVEVLGVAIYIVKPLGVASND